MAHQEYSGIISDEVRDEIRLYECARKYETIVKQFDELMGIMNNDTTVPIPKTKWRKSGRGGASDGRASSNQSNRNEAIVQTVTRFLHELRNNSADSNYSART
ncbi:uncharacterized protein LOC111242361 isoform X1 [Vigna radiata var. radiata]|uniref:Uncharacterized protein LOC111242361 isoform X1 n=1 Tax=Vigna radiata var. radiata TaxID=3916 RepID=A0A3Q0FA40_VIGRR|nr:uncharacterized protein LOC111242361 isoform X1 [Vigna radiata var. radiata]